MSEKRVDRRIGKTRDALANAMFALIQREDWGAITIQAICDEANVARASFYSHFDSKVGLLEFMIQRNLGGLAAHLTSMGGGAAAILGWFVEHVASDRSRFAKIVLTPDAHPALSRFTAVVREQYAHALKHEGIDVNDTEVHFIMGGTMELVMSWSRTWRMQQVPVLKANVLDFAGRVLGHSNCSNAIASNSNIGKRGS
jgi:AcrR family transcriptional regulator